jgi:membrane dipeptidase
VAIFPAVENGYAIENNLRNLENLRSFGIRYMTLTHARNLKWAASSGEEKSAFEGLTPFGKKVIAAMNEMGIIVDLSHVHESTFWAVLKESKRPPIASHSDAAALCATPRNLTDDQIKAIADKGGMIGINFFPGFLDKQYLTEQTKRCGDLFERFSRIENDYWHDPQSRAAGMHQLGDELLGRMANVTVGPEAILRHINHIIDLVGDDYVGFGSDFDGVPTLPHGISGCDIFPLLIGRMRSDGFSGETIHKISSANFMRVLKANP